MPVLEDARRGDVFGIGDRASSFVAWELILDVGGQFAPLRPSGRRTACSAPQHAAPGPAEKA